MKAFRFYTPNPSKILTAEEAQQYVRPLARCSSCRYVLCSCGNCHSEDCNQSCFYEVPSEVPTVKKWGKK